MNEKIEKRIEALEEEYLIIDDEGVRFHKGYRGYNFFMMELVDLLSTPPQSEEEK